MSDTVRVYVNSNGVDVAAGASALDAVRSWSVAEATAVEQGRYAITDSRGLPVANDHRVYAGAIFRLVTNRAGSPGIPSTSLHEGMEDDDAR